MNRNVHVPFLGEERTATFISLPDPRGKAKGSGCILGFRTGDLVRAVVTKGRKIGTYVGRVAIKSDGYFKLTGYPFGMVEGIHARFCRPIHRKDGYSYAQGAAALPPQA